jgi:hypothetical protein
MASNPIITCLACRSGELRPDVDFLGLMQQMGAFPTPEQQQAAT